MKNQLAFDDSQINLAALKERAFNLRWATQPADVIPLTAADPDFMTAPEIVNAIQSYAAAATFSYGPAEGLLEFRQAIVKFLAEKRSIYTDVNKVLPVDSAAQGMMITARYCLQPGDEAIVFDPVDFLFKTSVENAGGKTVLFPIDVKTGAIDFDVLQSLITPKTKMLCLCNPLNPSGKVFTKEELEMFGNIAVENDLWIMSDEIWSDIVYPGNTFTSIASISKEIAEHTITVYGFSKSYGLAGLRIGYIVAPGELVYEGLMETSQMKTTAYGISTISQIAGTAAYNESFYWVEAFIAHLTKMRDMVVQRLNKMKGVSCHLPQGCYVVFPDISKTGKTSGYIADYLLQEARVAVVPGAAKWFGPGAEGHIRLCFATSETILTEALNRIELALAKM